MKPSGRRTARSIWNLCLLSELGLMKDRSLIGVTLRQVWEQTWCYDKGCSKGQDRGTEEMVRC